jgi:hypothetical protein
MMIERRSIWARSSDTSVLKARSSEEYTNTQIPIGLRLGVRGGLQGFFGEVYAHIGYAIGSGAVLPELNTTPLFMSVGVGLGGGW